MSIKICYLNLHRYLISLLTKGGEKMNTYPISATGSTMRAGWTMIELILIMVVIGILATIAISKLSVTRDDAKLSADVSNMNICIRDMGNIYTATATPLKNIDSSACDRVVCYTMDINSTHIVVDINTTAPFYCDDLQNVGGHLLGTYQFSGSSIQR